jgi:hypothetical protein
MTTKIHICGPDGSTPCAVFARDDRLVTLAVGSKLPGDLVACTKAAKTLAGATSDGDVTYDSVFGGLLVNNIRVSHQPGETGAGNEDRALAIDVSGMDVQVVFGTDGDGGTSVPTATEVADAINADPQNHVVATAGGDGTGAVGSFTHTNLEGGLDDGDRYKWNVSPPRVDVINLIETV